MTPLPRFAAALTLCLPASASLWAAPEPVVVLGHAGVEAMMPDEKDAGLRAAVMMIADRIHEIPVEMERFSALAGPHDREQMLQAAAALKAALPFVTALMRHPTEFAVIRNPENELGVEDLDVRLLVSTGSAEASQEYTQGLLNILMAGMPQAQFHKSQIAPSMYHVPTPLGVALFGPTADGSGFAMGLDFGGDGLHSELIFPTMPVDQGLEGGTIQSRAFVDAHAAVEVAARFATLTGQPEVIDALAMVQEMMPAVPVGMEYVSTIGPVESRSVFRVRGLGAMGLGQYGIITDGPFIEPAHLELIPADARSVTLAASDLRATLEAQFAMAEENPGAADFRATLRNILGFDLFNDFLYHFGDVWATYTSDMTGGGGFISTVMLNSGADVDGLHSAMAALAAQANRLAGQYAMGYVSCRPFETEAADAAWTLTFNGLPIPLEVCCGLRGDLAVFAFTPQAMTAALEFTADENRVGLSRNTAFAEASAGLLDGQVTQVKFMDTARCLDRGYPAAAMLGSMMANLARSAVDPSRDPGIVVPSYHALLKDARPHLTVTRMEGNDLVIISTADRSALVNIAGLTGASGGSALGQIALVGAAVGAAAAASGM